MPLASQLNSKHVARRKVAVETLGNIGGRKVIQPLLKVLEDDSPIVQDAAAHALAGLKAPDALEPLLNLMKERGILAPVTPRIIQILGEISDVRALQPLMALRKVYKESQDLLPPTSPANILHLIERAVQHIEDAAQDKDHDSLCSQCFARYRKYKIKEQVFHTFSYYACHICGSNLYRLDGIKTMILVLDKDFRQSYELTDNTLRINWMKNKQPADFHQIHIVQATDLEVEEMVVKLVNRTDREARHEWDHIPVYISPQATLSQAKKNLLRHTFKEIKLVP